MRNGYTTGSCAAAAAAAAAECLLTGQVRRQISLRLPQGGTLILPVEQCTCTGRTASACVRKDSGDDPDVTDGVLVWADVSICAENGIFIDGGEGIGRVTKPGLDQPVGAAAINSTPRKMIAESVSNVLADTGCGEGGISVVIRIPEGVRLAEKTFNPKLGIVGGISVLGTTGIVEPMSDPALLATIRTELRVRRAEGYPLIAAAPGNYGLAFLRNAYGFPEELEVTASNFLAETCRMAAAEGFPRLVFAGHIGKLIKAAGGVENTHSKYGDRRMEILGEIAGLFLSTEERERILAELGACVMTDDALRILTEAGVRDAVMQEAVRRVKWHMERWTGGRLAVEAVMFSNVYGILGKTEQAEAYLTELREEAAKRGLFA